MASLESAETPYAIASVYSVHGSSSGKIGDKALFDKNGKRIIGYIGGGCIENRVAATAKETLDIMGFRIVDNELKLLDDTTW